MGLGSKKGAVLTATEEPKSLGGGANGGWAAQWRSCAQKVGARSSFLEEAVRSTNLLEATEGKVTGLLCPA